MLMQNHMSFKDCWSSDNLCLLDKTSVEKYGFLYFTQNSCVMLCNVVNFPVLIQKEIFCEPALKFTLYGEECWHEKCVFSIKLS